MQGERIYYQEDEYEFNLWDFIWYTLCQWRIILLVMIVLGIIFGGVGGINEFRRYSDKDLVKDTKDSYEVELAAYVSNKALLENKLERLQRELEQQKIYEENCLMLQVDPYNVYIHSISYYIDTNYEITPDLYYQNPNYTSVITNSYKRAIEGMDYDTIVATSERPSVTVKNPTTGSKRMVMTWTDADNGILNITVYGDTAETADILFEAVEEIIQKQETLLNGVIGEHSIKVLTDKKYVDVDADFSSLQETFNTKTMTIDSGIQQTSQNLASLVEPQDTTPTQKSIVKEAIKYGLIGAGAGLIFVIAYFLIQILIKDIVISARSLESKYDLPVLGVFCNNSKQTTKFDLYCENQLGVRWASSGEEQINFIVSNLLMFQKNSKKVLLIGSADPVRLQELKESLQAQMPDKEFVAAGNITKLSSAVNALEKDASVIDVEVWTRSLHRDLQKSLRLVKAVGCEQVGFIVLR